MRLHEPARASAVADRLQLLRVGREAFLPLRRSWPMSTARAAPADVAPAVAGAEVERQLRRDRGQPFRRRTERRLGRWRSLASPAGREFAPQPERRRRASATGRRARPPARRDRARQLRQRHVAALCELQILGEPQQRRMKIDDEGADLRRRILRASAIGGEQHDQAGTGRRTHDAGEPGCVLVIVSCILSRRRCCRSSRSLRRRELDARGAPIERHRHGRRLRPGPAMQVEQLACAPCARKT